MNILHNTAHFKAQAAQKSKGGNSLLDALGQSAKQDPKSIAALKADPKYAGLNFDHVLSAASKGHDPEAMANLLLKEKQGDQKQTNIPFLKDQGKDEGKAKIAQKKYMSDMPEVKELAKKSILNPMPQAQQQYQAQQPQRKSIFTTPRVLDIQSKSKYAGESQAIAQRPVANTQVMQINATAQLAPATKASTKISTQDQLAMRGMRKNNSLGSMTSPRRPVASMGYKSQSTSMIKPMAQNRKVESKEFDTLDPMNSQSESRAEMAQTGLQPKVMTTAATASAGKVIHLNQVDMSGNTDAIISQIQDYVMQTQASNQSEVAVSFEHQDLGKVDLLVQKLDPKSEQLNIQIATRGVEAAEFFKTHQGELINTLNRSGLQIADLKLDSSQSTQNQDLSQNSDKGFNGRQQEQHGSESGQRNSDQQRRQELWDQFYGNKEAA